MIKRFTLRAIYAVHMLAPLALVDWHIQRLSPSTIDGLRSLFGGI
jgi:hypothetical protein